jgi:low temperature requirement protein LtrA
MYASLLMSASIADAFADRAWLFVTGYLLLQVGRSAFLIVSLRGTPLSAHFVNNLVWELGAGVLWIAGAVQEGNARLVLWLLAVIATQVGVWSLHWLPGRGRIVDVAQSNVAAAHLIERFRLFFIIALGETVLVTGGAFASAQPFTLERLVALTIAFIGTAALWWCYFERAEPMAVGAAEGAEDAGRLGLRGTWTLVLLVLALIAVAVGDELAITHPHDDATLGSALLTFGGPALFLLAQVLFIARTTGHIPRSRLLALVALAALAVVTAPLPLIVGLAAATAVLVAVAIGDTVAPRTTAPIAPR